MGWESDGMPGAEGAAGSVGAAEAAGTSWSGPAIQAVDLTRRFGDFTAVDGVSFVVKRGEIFGFLGPNGSGKSTTIRMLTGLLPPTEGDAVVLGTRMSTDPEAVKGRIGYMSQRFSLYDDLTVDENLTFFGGVYGVTGARFAERRRFILRMADLVGHEGELAAGLSVGWKQRLALGCAIIHEPTLVFLDEPTGGVDPLARRHFWDMLYDMAAAGTTLFVTTHNMDEAEYCHMLAFIHEGRIIAHGSPRTIKAGVTTSVWRASGRPLDGVFDAVLATEECSGAVIHGAAVRFACDPGFDPVAVVLARMRERGVADAVLEPASPRLEDVFISLVGEEGAGALG